MGYTDETQGPTVTVKWITEDDFGRKLKESILSVSINDSPFVPFSEIKANADIMYERASR